jgi:hypothetical protein
MLVIKEITFELYCDTSDYRYRSLRDVRSSDYFYEDVTVKYRFKRHFSTLKEGSLDIMLSLDVI